ncbi:hypothetical protein HDU87_003232 [Geranomyces variabilis]|uniref:Uncharacterized protein n=1 Tax=Geranomyces variabilis TaxID=109894 RepID=A0AAD5TL57_9FUNG|nr:hypothetical protein HDU87_003232 [Geranomyces variabilis]
MRPPPRATEYEYVDTVNLNLLCCICYCPFIDPVSSPCGHTFCRLCASAALSSAQTCPVDRAPLSLAQLQPAARVITSMVEELQVPRGALEVHVEECGHGLVTCEVCQSAVKNKDIEAHATECPGSTVTCPDCREPILRSGFSEHASICQEATMSCPHISHGCPWEGKRRLFYSDHKSSCPFEAIKGFFILNDQKMDALTRLNMTLKSEISDLRTEIAILRDAPPVPVPAAFLPPIVEETADRMGQLLLDTDLLRGELMNINAGFSALEMRQDVALLNETARLREEMHSVRALCQAVQSQLLNFALDRRKETSSNITSSVLTSTFNALAGSSGDSGNTTGNASPPLSAKKGSAARPVVPGRSDSSTGTKL